MPFPVFCAGPSAPLNLAQHHAVESNVPIGCGGVAVYPGDIIVGDRDGVAVIPAAMADEVARDAAEQEELEEFLSATCDWRSGPARHISTERRDQGRVRAMARGVDSAAERTHRGNDKKADGDRALGRCNVPLKSAP